MELKIDHHSPIPLHAQVEELLRKLIEEPDYQNGAFLPKEVELSKTLGISRNTVRHAINKLVFEGLLVRKKGQGTRVAENVVTTQLDSWQSFTQEMSNKGVELINYEKRIEIVKATAKLAEFFQIEKGSELIQLCRLRGHEDGPFVYFESYFHPRVGINKDETFETPLYTLLEEKYATIATTSKEQIKARLSSTISSKKLGIKSGEPVLVRERKVLDPGGRPIEFNIGYYNANKFVYSIDIHKNKA